jgi:hypothetical protein
MAVIHLHQCDQCGGTKEGILLPEGWILVEKSLGGIKNLKVTFCRDACFALAIAERGPRLLMAKA